MQNALDVYHTSISNAFKRKKLQSQRTAEYFFNFYCFH